eukprot:Hpha_TRINITY_DN15774_c1_g2::TRINITY_DN15774_c1_g2_i1::g.40577::m.40577
MPTVREKAAAVDAAETHEPKCVVAERKAQQEAARQSQEAAKLEEEEAKRRHRLSVKGRAATVDDAEIQYRREESERSLKGWKQQKAEVAEASAAESKTAVEPTEPVRDSVDQPEPQPEPTKNEVSPPRQAQKRRLMPLIQMVVGVCLAALASQAPKDKSLWGGLTALAALIGMRGARGIMGR